MVQSGSRGRKEIFRTFSQRLRDCFGKIWHEKLDSSDFILKYKLVKQNFGTEEYISSVKGHFRDALLRFRAGVSWIKAHSFRFNPGTDTSCPFCPHETEDELHVLFLFCFFCLLLLFLQMHNHIRPDFFKASRSAG